MVPVYLSPDGFDVTSGDNLLCTVLSFIKFHGSGNIIRNRRRLVLSVDQRNEKASDGELLPLKLFLSLYCRNYSILSKERRHKMLDDDEEN